MSSAPIAAIAAVQMLHGSVPVSPVAVPQAAGSFAQMLMNGVDAVNTKAINADNMVRAFTLDDSIPVHQVTLALAQAQLSLGLMVHVRDRLVDGFQQLMNMQL